MALDNAPETKSVTCSLLPESFISDKQEAKKFFAQFGSIKNFIFKPSRQEYTIEFDTFESAQRALSAQVNFHITPTKPEPKPSEEYIDPDVQAELESMLPVGAKASKQTIESFIKNPPPMFLKSKLFASPRQKTEPITISADHGQIQAAKAELEVLARKPARTLEEKLSVLDARDKLYRLLTARPLDIKRATSTKGTCKDMCPEKERIMREARLQVASFEFDENSEFMDPMKAIKQYSRSSADQEIPLPHELRSEEVLKTTMTYMLHNIMDLCDDEETSIGDWYHFVWDRTRGIRKDITQQESCSEMSVELLEQCARFHIHCSARLVAEGPGIFDQKINDENLTKSLQTLKYMYDDLKMKNVKCQNEAEFRAYVVLLNLNESGNFLWEIKRLEKHILKSSEVRFALDVYFALALNNYVKFFNLVREASYMSACILMKYFTQVRLKAIEIISRSTLSVIRKSFSIPYLTEVLAFEDDMATINFLQYHGSQCNTEGQTNLGFRKPELPFQMNRSAIVESKMEGSVSEAICGGKLPSPDCFLSIQPHSSFDENGCLKKGAFYIEDQNGPLPIKDNIFKVPKESPPVSAKNAFQQKSAAKNDQADGQASASNVFFKSNPFENPFSTVPKANIFGSANPFANSAGPSTGASTPPQSHNNIFGQLIKSSQSSSAGTSTLFGSPTINASPSMKESPISANSSESSPFGTSPGSQSSSFGSQPIPNFAFETLQQRQEREREAARLAEEKRVEEERVRRQNEEAEERMRLKLQEKIRIEQEKREHERKLLEEEERQRREKEAQQKKKLQEAAENICESLIDEIVASNVSFESKRACKLYIDLPKDFYEVLEHDVVVEQLIKLYQEEHLGYINSTKLKFETMAKFFKHWRQITVKEIHRRQLLSKIGCPTLNKSLEEHAKDVAHPEQHLTLSNMKQYLKGSPQQIQLPDLDAYKKIDLFKDLKFSHENLPGKLFWKVLISVPLKNIEKSMSFACFIKKWLNKTFDVDDENNSEIFYLKRQIVHQMQRMMSICIRKVQGAECIDENGKASDSNVRDANSLVFFCTTANLKESRNRLQNILSRLENPISVSIIIYKSVIGPNDEELLRNHMDLSSEVKVKHFEINLYYECHEKSKDLTEVVVESCQFLCDNYLKQLTREYSKLFDLEMQHLLDFVQFYFGDEMWQRIEISCKDSKEFNKHMASFNNVIKIFNACIDKIVKIVTIDSRSLPSLPSEFRSLLPAMEIRIPHSFEYFPENWKSNLEQKSLAAFLLDLKLKPMADDNFKNFNDYKEKLSVFLENNLSAFKNQTYHAVTEKIVHSFYVLQLKGLDSVDQVLPNIRWLHILGSIVIGKFNELYQQRKAALPKFVIYYKKDLRSYTIPWWYTMNFGTSKENEPEPSTKRVKHSQKIDPNELQSLLKRGKDCLKKANDIIVNSRQNTQRTREDSKTFDQYLRQCEEQFRGIKRSLHSMQEKP